MHAHAKAPKISLVSGRRLHTRGHPFSHRQTTSADQTVKEQVHVVEGLTVKTRSEINRGAMTLVKC
jgi:hypothetical protein